VIGAQCAEYGSVQIEPDGGAQFPQVADSRFVAALVSEGQFTFDISQFFLDCGHGLLPPGVVFENIPYLSMGSIFLFEHRH
jgi:hypothetical protein